MVYRGDIVILTKKGDCKQGLYYTKMIYKSITCCYYYALLSIPYLLLLLWPGPYPNLQSDTLVVL